MTENSGASTCYALRKKIIRITSIFASQCAACAISLSAQAATFTGTSGPDIIVGPNTEDLFFGFDGDDKLYGDFFFEGHPDIGFPDIEIPCKAGAGVEHQPVTGASGDVVSLLNDRFSDGPGNDLVVGDAHGTNFGEFQLNALSGTGAIMGGDGGDFNAARCFVDTGVLDFGEDSFSGGDGDDVFVGDADYSNVHSEDVELDAGAGSAGMGRYSFFPHGPGGDGGDNNTVEAFNDTANFKLSLRGMKTLIGDVRGTGTTGSQDRLIASAGSGGRSGGDGGNTNTISAFNDRLSGGHRGNLIVGDDFRDGGVGDVMLVASAGAGGQDSGGVGGSNNVVQAFSDVLQGSSNILLGFRNGEFIVGDVLLDGGPTDDLQFTVYAGFTQPGGGAGGAGNVVSAFNDVINGDFGPDTLIGDAWNKGASDAIRIVVGVDSGNSVQAFADTINGGPSSDLIYGDFRFDSDVCKIDQFDLIGAIAQSSLFNDRLDAGFNNDTVHGGFGADTMTGGQGRDTFVYYGPDLADLGSGIPVDLITDFMVLGPFSDRFDMRPLLGCLGFDSGDDINDWLRVSGTTMQIDRDGPGSGFTFESMIAAPGILGRTVNFLSTNGNLLVP